MNCLFTTEAAPMNAMGKLHPWLPMLRQLYRLVARTLLWCSALIPLSVFAQLPPRPVQFSLPSGNYANALTLDLSTRSEDALIYYTLDGSDPGRSSTAMHYREPLSIDEPLVVRAIAIGSDGQAAAVVTRTYLFAARIASQGNDQSSRGMPALWQTRDGLPEAPDHRLPSVAQYSRPADYAIDSRISRTSGFAGDLLGLPIICLAFDPADLFSVERGIYANSSKDWRVPVAIEWLDSDGSSQIHATASGRILGDLSRREDVNVKHGFMIHFIPEMGPSTIPNTVFGNSPAAQLNRVAIRSVWGDSWLRNNATRATLLRDQFALDSFRAMGHFSPASRMVSLYLNGLYWGIYQATERPEDNWMEYLTGIDASEWDIIKGVIYDDELPEPEDFQLGNGRNGRLIAGNLDSWNALFELADSIPATANDAELAAIGEFLDLDNFIDYVILNMYAVNWDWPQKNWYAVAARAKAGGPPQVKWRFVPWDTEAVFHFHHQTINPANFTNRFYKGAARLWRPLWRNAEFAMRFADRLQRHYFADGAMTPQATLERFSRMADLLDPAIIGESARWGDWINPANPYTRAQWRGEVARLKRDYFPHRTASSLHQFRQLGLYPQLAAPQFDLPAGEVEAGTVPTLSAPVGTIYFGLNGVDPRVHGGGVHPDARVSRDLPAITDPTRIIARVRSGSSWSARSEAVYVPRASPPALVITEIMSSSAHTGAIDWFEVTHVGEQPINLSGYSWEDDQQRVPRPVLPQGLIIQPGESIIISNHQDPRLLRQNWGMEDAVQVVIAAGPGLGNGDAVTLYHADGRALVSRAYAHHRSGVSRFWFTDGTTVGEGFSREGEYGAWRAPRNGGLAGVDVGSPGVAMPAPATMQPSWLTPPVAYAWAGWPLGYDFDSDGVLLQYGAANPAQQINFTLLSAPAFVYLRDDGSGSVYLASRGNLAEADIGSHLVRIRIDTDDPGPLSAELELMLQVLPGGSPLILNEFNAVSAANYLNGGDANRDQHGKSAPDYAADAIFGRVQGNGGNWFELVVTGDGGPGVVDLRGWRIEIATNAAVPFVADDVIVLANHPFWAAVHSGTILTFIENNNNHAGLDTGFDLLDHAHTAGWRWTNVWIGDAGLVDQRLSSGFSVNPLTGQTSGLRINNSNTHFVIKDDRLRIVFGPAGEGISPASGVGSSDVFKLAGDPHPWIRPLAVWLPLQAGYTDASLSTFGAPNRWHGGLREQAFTRFIPTMENSYRAWRTRHRIGAAVSGYRDSVAGDGIANYIKFLLGADPHAAGLPQLQSLLPCIQQPTNRIALPLRDYVDPAAITVQWSSDLALWHNLLLDQAEHVETGLPEPAFSTYTLQLPEASSDAFIRIMVDLPSAPSQ